MGRLNSGGNSLTIENTTVSPPLPVLQAIRFIGGATGNTITNCSVKGANFDVGCHQSGYP